MSTQCSRHTSRHTTTFRLGSSRHFGHLHDTFRGSSQLLHGTPDAIHISRYRVSLPPPFISRSRKNWFGLIFQVLTALISGVGYGLPFVSSLSDEPCLPSFNTEPSPSSKARYLSHWCGSLKRGQRREPMESWSKQPMITPTWDQPGISICSFIRPTTPYYTSLCRIVILCPPRQIERYGRRILQVAPLITIYLPDLNCQARRILIKASNLDQTLAKILHLYELLSGFIQHTVWWIN